MTSAGADNPTASHQRTTREWVVLAVGTVVVAALCLFAGQWQWNRHVNREALIATVVENFDAPAAPLSHFVKTPGQELNPDDEWRTVTVSGTYRPQDTVLLRNRPVESTAGFHVLVPFKTSEGLIFVVDRGFVPMGSDGSEPESVPEPPEGTITLTARLQPDEAKSTRGAPAGQTQAINTGQVLQEGENGAEWASGQTTSVYLALLEESPEPAQRLHGLPKPSTDPGSHLSYTFQWVVFAVGAIGGFLVLLRRERLAAIRRRHDAEGPAAPLPEDTPTDVAAWITGTDDAEITRRKERRRPTDEETEDAQLDALGY